jgi:hypothetical protein
MHKAARNKTLPARFRQTYGEQGRHRRKSHALKGKPMPLTKPMGVSKKPHKKPTH